MNLNELERLAKAATPGPYTVERNTIAVHVTLGNGVRLADIAVPYAHWHDTDRVHRELQQAEFFAACSPEVVLALVNVAKAAREYIEHYNLVGWEDACHPTNLEEALETFK